MELDFSQAYQVWDNVQPVRYELARRSPAPPDNDPLLSKGPNPPAPAPPARPRVLFLQVAKRRQLTRAEKAASGGVYTGAHQVWIIPDAVFPPGTVSKPADVVTEVIGSAPDVQPGDRWTVLDMAWTTNRQTRKLTCINLALAYDLRDTITVERAQVTYDAAGAAVKLYPSGPPPNGGEVLYAQVPARVQLLEQQVVDERGIRGGERRYDVWVGSQLDWVTTEDRVLLSDGSYLDIVGYRAAQRIDELPALECRRRV